jgi:hypothetical protein
MFDRRVRLCIRVLQWCLINHIDFLIDYAKKIHTHLEVKLSLTKTLHLLLLEQLLIYVDLIEIAYIAILIPQSLFRFA